MPAPAKLKVPLKRVKVEMFSIHGHTAQGAVDYGALFAFLGQLPRRSLTIPVLDRFMAVVPLAREGSLFSFAAYSGFTDTNFLVFDLDSTTEEVRGLEPGKAVAQKTLCVIDVDRREAAIQFVYHGPRAGQIALLFEQVARAQAPEMFPQLSLEFAPVPGGEFVEQIQKFTRIQSAHLKLTRPNYDWEDYGNALTTLGQESGARNLEVIATANRNGTLRKNEGVVGLIQDLVGRSRSIVKAASVIGSREADGGLISLNLERHIESIKVDIPVGENKQPKQGELQQAMTNILSERPIRVE